MIQGKSGTVSYKNQKLIGKPEESWVRVENTHEALIDMETWETVRLLQAKKFKPRPASDNSRNMFTGLLVCADCGFNMRAAIEKGVLKNGEPYKYVSFKCGNYMRSGKTACTIHTISENALVEIILNDIQAHAESVIYDERRAADKIRKAKNQEALSYLALYKQELKSSETRTAELEQIISTLYEDKVNGIITDTMFKNLSSKYEAERVDKEKSDGILRSKIKKCERENLSLESWVKNIRKYEGFDSLTQGALIELIDKIKVYEAERVGKQRVCKIDIFYRYAGNVKEALFEVGEGDGNREQTV